jgi:hypothetical protein
MLTLPVDGGKTNMRGLILLLPVLLVLFLAGKARSEEESSLVGEADLHSNLLPAGEKVAVREAREAGKNKKNGKTDLKKKKLKNGKGKDRNSDRIFEGTNEINRMLTVSMILRKANKGEIDLMNPAKAITKELMSIPDFNSSNGSVLSQEIKMVKNFKKALLLVAGISVQKLGENLAKEQEVLMNIADIINTIYLCESTLLRVQKVGDYENYKEQLNMLKVLVFEAGNVKATLFCI